MTINRCFTHFPVLLTRRVWVVRSVEIRTFTLNLRILFLTLRKIFRREGVSAQGEATMPEFKPASRHA